MEAMVGGLVFMAGMALRAVAGIYLVDAGWSLEGARFVRVPPGIATGGPYRYLNHPAYMGSLLMFTGLGLVCLGWGGAVVSVAAWPFYKARMVEEDRILEEVKRGG